MYGSAALEDKPPAAAGECALKEKPKKAQDLGVPLGSQGYAALLIALAEEKHWRESLELLREAQQLPSDLVGAAMAHSLTVVASAAAADGAWRVRWQALRLPFGSEERIRGRGVYLIILESNVLHVYSN